jgi:hypothetical protein
VFIQSSSQLLTKENQNYLLLNNLFMKSFVSEIKLALFLLIILSNQGQSQNWLWAAHIGSSLNDIANGVSDKNGNFYIAGTFNGQFNQFLDTSLFCHGNNGMFLAKYDNNGQEKWVSQFDADNFPFNCYDGIGDIMVDVDDNIYVTGLFYSNAHFGNISLNANNGDMFLAKFSSSGNCLWAKKAGGSGKDGGTGLAIDSAYNVYVCGQNFETAQFDSLNIDQGGFLAKYDSSGLCMWVKKIVSYSSYLQQARVQFTCMKIDKDKLLMCGGEMVPSFSVDTMIFNHPGYGGQLLCCFNLSGNIKWAKEGISIGANSGVNMAVDSIGNIYITGQFDTFINFGDTVLHGTASKLDNFIAKYNSSGDFFWGRYIHSGITTSIGTIISDDIGNTYVSGGFSGKSVFCSDTLYSDTQEDMYLARYNMDGECLGATHFGSAEGLEVGIDGANQPIVVGVFPGIITIGANTFTSFGDKDIFVAKCSAITGTEPKSIPQQTQLLIYANPTTGKCNIKIPEDFRHEKSLVLQIFDHTGKMIQNIPVLMDQEKISLNISAEARGMYNAILSNGKKRYSGKIIFE